MRKKLFAVIMSVMMMVTFMPTMAFADASIKDVDWSADYTSVTWKDAAGNEHGASGGKIIREANVSGDVWDGTIHAYVDGNEEVGANYFDLGSASVAKINGVALDSSVTAYEHSAVIKLFEDGNKDGKIDGDVELSFSVPSYADNRNEKPNTKYVRNMSFEATAGALRKAVKTLNPSADGNIELYVKAIEYDIEKMFEKQVFPIVTTLDTVNPLAGKMFINGIKDQSVTVKAYEPSADLAVFTVDGKGTYVGGKTPAGATPIGDTDLFYNGENHTFAQKDMTGVSSTYKLYNSKTGKWESVSSDAFTFKNVDTYLVEATTKDSKKTNVSYFEIKVSITNIKPGVGFVENDSIYTDVNTTGHPRYYKVGSKFDPKDYIDVYEYGAIPVGQATTKEEKAFKSAIKADKALMMDYFNDFYQITTEEGKFAKGTFKSTIETKDGLEDLTAAEKDALVEKYATLFKNYYGTDLTKAKLEYDNFLGYETATFVVDDDVTFTYAPLNKAYKAKNGKLAKTKHFKIKAKSLSGADVNYKITNGGSRIKINRTTGKVTVKKGLKKGTRVVTVTAWSSLYADAYDTYKLRIKVK